MERVVYAPTTLVHGYAPTATGRHFDRLMPRDLNRWYPRFCLVSVLDDYVGARRAAAELRQAGFSADDVCLVLAEEFNALDDHRRARGVLARIMAGARTLGDESFITQEYVAQTRRGKHLLVICAPGEAAANRARAIVERYQAHTTYYFGRWAIRGLPSTSQHA